MRRLTLASCLALAFALSGPVAHAADKPTERDKKASQLIAKAQWVDAAALLRELVSEKPTATRLFNLAQAERNLGALADAKEHFAGARDAAKAEGLGAVAGAAEQAMGALDARVPRLVLDLPAGVEGVRVRIDGREVTPASDGSVEVNPGTRRLEVTAPGYVSHEQTLAPRPADRLEVSVELKREAGPEQAPTKDTPTAKDDASAGGGPPLPAIILGGVGIAALAGGTAFHFVSQSKYDDATANCTKNGDTVSCPKSVKDDPEHQQLLDDSDSAKVKRNILIGVGAAALVAGGVWWYLDASSSSSTEVGLLVTPGGAGAQVRWHAW